MGSIEQGGTEVYTVQKARKRGKKDAKSWAWNSRPPFWPPTCVKTLIPADDQETFPDYIIALTKVFQNEIQKISDAWSKEDQILLSEFCAAKADHDMKESQLEREDKEKVEAAKALQKLKEDYLNFPPPWINPRKYWVIFGIIIAAEGIFNFSVFRIFGTADYESWLIATGLIVIIPLAAEVIGHHLKAEKKSVGGIIGSALVASIMIALFIVLAILRDKFLQTNEETRIPISEETLVFMLIVMNLAIFGVMTFLAYTQARKDSDTYETVKNQYEHALKNADAQIKDVLAAEEKLAAVRERLALARSKRERQFSAHQEQAARMLELCGIAAAEYQTANMAERARGRGDAKRPKCFEMDPAEELEIPENLRSINWDCPEQKVFTIKSIPVTPQGGIQSSQGASVSEKTDAI